MKPTIKPQNPCFSSGPCAKHPGFSLDELNDAPLGRSHRSSLGKGKLAESIPQITLWVLCLPRILEPLKWQCGRFWGREE